MQNILSPIQSFSSRSSIRSAPRSHRSYGYISEDYNYGRKYLALQYDAVNQFDEEDEFTIFVLINKETGIVEYSQHLYDFDNDGIFYKDDINDPYITNIFRDIDELAECYSTENPYSYFYMDGQIFQGIDWETDEDALSHIYNELEANGYSPIDDIAINHANSFCRLEDISLNIIEQNNRIYTSFDFNVIPEVSITPEIIQLDGKKTKSKKRSKKSKKSKKKSKY